MPISVVNFFCPCQEGINDEECLCNEILRITETCVLIKHSLNNYFLSSLVGIAETQMSFSSLVIALFFPECMVYLYFHRRHTFIKHLQR